MANALTGDFEGVLQVSGGTINRLLATLHQNNFRDAALPSFPHNVWVRLGDDQDLGGVRGTMQAQVSVPTIELINGSSDRFHLEVGLLARYLPDPTTSPFPGIYPRDRPRRLPDRRHRSPLCRLEHTGFEVSLDPCHRFYSRLYWYGRTERAQEVARGLFLDAATAEVNASAHQETITEVIRLLLSTTFEATPHPVARQFRRGHLRSLSSPTDGSAVALAVGLSGEPVGDLASIEHVVLSEADFALAVSVDYIMTLLEQAREAISGFNPTVAVHVDTGSWNPIPDIDTVYHVTVNPPSVTWVPFGSFALFKVHLEGAAKTGSILPDATFSVDQDIVLSFDPGSQRLWLTRGSNSVSTHTDGLGSSEIAGAVNGAVAAAVKATVDRACSDAQPQLDGMLAGQQGVVDQLRTLDDQANASLDAAEFTSDGMILRGAITLTARRPPVVTYDKATDANGFSAFSTWLPGGRIDKFEWSWISTGTQEKGWAIHNDRFVLQRPQRSAGRWGLSVNPAVPLPGIDCAGQVCLTVQGVQIDAVTGAWVAAQQVVHCDRFATRFNVRSGAAARLLLRDFGDLSTGVPVSHLPVAAPQRTVSTSHGPNTLIVYCEEAWDSEIIPTLRAGLERCGRDDCGLVLLVLLREGLLDSIESSPVRQVAEFAGEFGIAAIVNEDVGSAWSTMLGLKDDAEVQSWRLLSPAGGVTWMHSGRIGGDGLASALDQCLLPSPAPTLERIRGTTLDVGDRAPVVGLHSGIAATGAAHCPPLPLGRLGKGSVVAFVRGDSRASEALLEELAARHPQDGDQSPFVVAVVVGASPRDAQALERALGVDFPLLGDADGTITDRFGISIWPTTLTLDQTARVVATETSNDSEPRRWDRPTEVTT